MQTINQVLSPLFRKQADMNTLCTSLLTASMNNKLKEPVQFEQVKHAVQKSGEELGYIISNPVLNDNIRLMLSTFSALPTSYIELVKLSKELAVEFYKSPEKVLDVIKDNWTKGEFPKNYKLDSDWQATIENQVLYEIYKAEPKTTIDQLLVACRKNLMTKETESSPAHSLTEKRADQYTRKVLKWYRLFQKISEKHGEETSKMFN